ncbi:hypothetical protein E1A91_A13G247700v1 [Gossypium mustelinum]|uniref:Uncharacterized protein n=1 Tax=Gossypium mustelinum TaxID=34275 RepID=A0A5D2WMB5_GOSMU|nr:hypothetical protein E1A91_A13G247700v1 [Gossypium mustelinum]
MGISKSLASEPRPSDISFLWGRGELGAVLNQGTRPR